MEQNKDFENHRLRADFLAQRLEELRDENFRLHSMIASLKDEIHLEKITIRKLNDMNSQLMKEINENKCENKSQEKQSATTFLRKLTTFNLVLNSTANFQRIANVPRKNTFNTQEEFFLPNHPILEEKKEKAEKNEKSPMVMACSEGDKDPLENDEASRNIIKSRESLELCQGNVQEGAWKDKMTAFLKENGVESTKDLAKVLSLEDINRFFSNNHMMAFRLDSPGQRGDVTEAEKKVESAEELLKEWLLKLKEIQKAKGPFIAAIEGILHGIEKELPQFKTNIELNLLMSVFSEVFKTVVKDFESFLTSLKEALESLFGDLKLEFNSIKEPKRRYYSQMEDFEKFQMKVVNIKKSQIQKSPAVYQTMIKTYLDKMKQFEMQKLEYLKCLNQTNFKFNIALNDKLCFLFLCLATIFGNGCERINFIQDFIQINTENLSKKAHIANYLEESFKNSLVELDTYVKTYNLYPNHKLTELSGYLFKKSSKSKDLKKRYYLLSSGTLSTFKHSLSREISPLSLINLKQYSDPEYSYAFELACPSRPKPLILFADSQKAYTEWSYAITNNIELMLSKSLDPSLVPTNEPKSSKIQETVGMGRDRLIAKILKAGFCADCGHSDACWVSLNSLVLLCLECSGIHRKLGPNVSKVRSLKLDNLGSETVEMFREVGTGSANQIWEAEAQMNGKPGGESKGEAKERWIKRKYVDREFINRKIGGIEYVCEAIRKKNLVMVLKGIVGMNLRVGERMKIGEKISTLMHFASLYGNTMILEFLINCGASLNETDEEGRKPVDVAMMMKKDEIVDFLNAKNST